jgi:hypothetical protein
MTPEQAAAELDGREYGEEIDLTLQDTMKLHGLVAVYGASDDNMEFVGAIFDEVGAFQGGFAYLTDKGLLKSECDDEDCPYFAKLQEKAATIEAIWDENGIDWQFKTKIKHVTFIIKENGNDFCRGIVFALADVKKWVAE